MINICRTVKFFKTWCSWIRASWYNYENNKQYALYRLIYDSESAVHVSGNVFAHHQEHFPVFTVSVSVHPSWCWLVSRMSRNWRVSPHSGHQPAATCVNTTRYCKCSWWWEKHRPKHVQLTWHNKLVYIVHFVGYSHSHSWMCFLV
jgi:hypothetical protein